MSLVIWIAVMKLLILFLYIYVDDSFSAQHKGQVLYYQCYGKSLPSNLTHLLQLWDYIGLPHKEKKQVFSEELPIIGFNIDPNLMHVRMTDESKQQLLAFLREFGVHGTRWPLRDFQRIAGYLNWALNVYPLLCPGLCTLCLKTAGKRHQRALLWVNCNVE